MEKYAITDNAAVIEEILIKSSLYSKVYLGPESEELGSALSLDEANALQFKKIQKFKKILNSWQSKYDCKAMNVKEYQEEYKACLKISSSSYFKSKSLCEEVTENYVICNGTRYVLDLNNNNGLKRDTKKIEDFIDSRDNHGLAPNGAASK